MFFNIYVNLIFILQFNMFIAIIFIGLTPLLSYERRMVDLSIVLLSVFGPEHLFQASHFMC